MNAINPGAAPLSKSQVEQDYMMAAARAHDHLQDLHRVQSIVWGLADALRAEFHEAEEGTGKIETAEPKAFLENVVWLVELLVDKAEPLEVNLRKLGLKL